MRGCTQSAGLCNCPTANSPSVSYGDYDSLPGYRRDTGLTPSKSIKGDQRAGDDKMTQKLLISASRTPFPVSEPLSRIPHEQPSLNPSRPGSPVFFLFLFYFILFYFIFLFVCFFILQVLIRHQFYTHQCIHVNPNCPIQHTTIPT